VGKQYSHEITFDQNSEMALGGAPQTMQLMMTQGFTLSAEKAGPEGGVELELKFTSIKVSTKMGGREMMGFDSVTDVNKDPGDLTVGVLRRVIGAHVRFLTDANGKIEKMEGYKEFMDKLTAGTPQSMQMMFEGMFREEMLRQFGAGAEVLPDKAIKPGDTWPHTKETISEVLGKVSTQSKFTFAGWEQHGGKNCAVVTSTGDMMSIAPPGTNSNVTTIENGKLKSKFWFDPAVGTILENTGEQTMDINMNMQGKKVISKTKQNVVIKMTGIEDIAKKN
jgi:Family of unknown function (DUF6263)